MRAPDIPLGTPVAGRTEAELDQLIGFCINIVVLRNDLRGNPTLRDLLLRTRDTALAAYAHQDLPFDHVVDAVRPVRSLSRNPLFGVVVHVREALPTDHVIEAGSDGQTTFTALEPPFDVAHADLSVNFFATEDGYRGHVIYRTDLYRRATAERLVAWLGRVLAAFADDPDQRLRDVQIACRDEHRQAENFSAQARVSLLDHWRDPVTVGVVGDVYEHYVDEETTKLRPTGQRARWTEDGRVEFVDVPEPPRPSASSGPFEPARTQTEQALAAILADVLDAPEIGRHDDFFSLGGDSILAVQLAARARDAGLALTARMVFEHPALYDLADVLDGATSAPEPGDAHHAPMTASGLSADELAAVTASWSVSQDGAR